MKFIYVLIFSFFLIQCGLVKNQSNDFEEAPESMKNFVKTIWEDPNKLLNLKQNFPELIIDSLLHCEMKDPKYISEMISFIEQEFSDTNIAKTFKLVQEPYGSNLSLSLCSKVLNSISNNPIFVLYHHNSNKIVMQLYWIKMKTRYILCKIEYGYIAPTSVPIDKE